jgi:hypothetical protein
MLNRVNSQSMQGPDGDMHFSDMHLSSLRALSVSVERENQVMVMPVDAEGRHGIVS